MMTIPVVTMTLTAGSESEAQRIRAASAASVDCGTHGHGTVYEEGRVSPSGQTEVWLYCNHPDHAGPDNWLAYYVMPRLA
jgi:DhnA family fructose-bisphosphate aldolase class Ia